MSKVKLSAVAESDLAEIWFYIAQDNVEAADRFVDLFYEKCLLLVESPGMGTRRLELSPGIRSFPFGNYIIFYRSVERDIEVARVLSGSRDIPTVFEDE